MASRFIKWLTGTSDRALVVCYMQLLLARRGKEGGSTGREHREGAPAFRPVNMRNRS
jgi:hypothetical protein